MITLKDLVGSFTLIEVPQSALSLLKAKVNYLKALHRYRVAEKRKPDDPNQRISYLRNYKKTMAAFDEQKNARDRYEKEKDKFKNSFRVKQ